MHARLRLALALAAASALLPAGAVLAAPRVPAGFTVETIARVAKARELAVAPNGDLFVGTYGSTVVVVPNAEGTPGEPKTFAGFEEGPAAGVFLTADTLFVGTQFGVWRIPYRTGDRTAREAPRRIARVRTSGQSRDHVTTTIVESKGMLYASVGSSCNACSPELDATRATIQTMRPDGSDLHARAVDIRNAIALAVQPETGDVWAGVAGRDELEHGHPYELFDDVTAHAGTPDYGWLTCYDDRKPIGGASCANVVVPKAVFPAYETPIGAVFYPSDQRGRYAFPKPWRGGAFVTLHGSWHTPLVPPRVAFVPFARNEPAKPVDWADPAEQWEEFLGGCQPGDARVCRPTGIAVGGDGSLFVADDDAGAIYRIRPSR